MPARGGSPVTVPRFLPEKKRKKEKLMPRLTPTDAADEHRLLTESFTSPNQQAYARSVLESITASSLRDLSTAQRRETAKHQFDVLTSATRIGETAFLSLGQLMG